MKRLLLYIANWKMNSSFEQSLTFCTRNKTELIDLSKQPDTTLVLCPSFPALYPLAQLFASTPLAIGAQNCSAYDHGAYTGQVDARSLAQIGSTYCIVGHAELRTYCGETSEQIAEKIIRLREQNITPIICIGETETEYRQGATHEHLEAQLRGTLQRVLTQSKKDASAHASNNYIIAYEPVWAIGAGTPPALDYVEAIFTWLRRYCSEHMPHASIKLIYGGSVDENDAAELKKIDAIDGFLIGSASLDFQKLQKIVVCSY